MSVAKNIWRRIKVPDGYSTPDNLVAKPETESSSEKGVDFLTSTAKKKEKKHKRLVHHASFSSDGMLIKARSIQ